MHREWGFGGCLVGGVRKDWRFVVHEVKGPEIRGEMPFFCALFCALWVVFCRDFLS